jgi:hypothetical protein
MERTLLLEHLETARQHLAEGQSRVRKQRDLIAKLLASGRDITTANTVLLFLEDGLHNYRNAALEKVEAKSGA